MARNATSNKLRSARQTKNDEFYTQLVDIENELRFYKKYFKGKTVLCNCDDPRVSNFFHYFSYGFEHLELKRLITTCYKSQERDLFSQNDSEGAICLEYLGDKNGNRVPDIEEIGVNYLNGDGDFRSEECIKLLEQADIVCTNPPFSLFREYVAQLMDYNKKFIIIGNMNAASYKEIFSLIRDNKIWVGVNEKGGTRKGNSMSFGVPGSNQLKDISSWWFTNLDHSRRHEELPLFRKYTAEDYPKYDQYDAIEVSKTVDIPCDYNGIMGVPISFLVKYNPDQFEIVGIDRYVEDNPHYGHRFTMNGVEKYARILIRRKRS